MRRFLFKRLGLALITLVLISFAVFLVAQVLPGDVGRTMLGPYASNAQVTSFDHQLGVDRPLPVQYWNWITNFVQGNWGQSYLLNTPVRPMVFQRLLNSLALGVFALLLILPVSIGLGVVAALNQGKV